MTTSPSLKIGYWDIHGLVEFPRAIAYFYNVPVEWVDYKVVRNEDGTYDRSCWLDEKFTLGLDFPNLPYLMDKDLGISITQSNAITRHVARKAGEEHHLLGKNPADEARVAMLEGYIVDLRTPWVRLCYGTYDQPGEREKYLEGVVKGKFSELNAYFEKHGSNYLVGDYLTYVDFMLFEYLDQHLTCQNDLLTAAGLTRLQTYYETVLNLEKMQKYRKERKHRSFNNIMAKFGGSPL
eukprot:Nk52_evm8s2118 gene=Nk52_evmTU8s2118